MEIAKPSKMFETQKINGNESIGEKKCCRGSSYYSLGRKKKKKRLAKPGKNIKRGKLLAVAMPTDSHELLATPTLAAERTFETDANSV